jgi:hypothetical protein
MLPAACDYVLLTMYNYACVLAFVDIVRAGSPVTIPPGPRVAASGAIAMLAACCVC